MVRVPVALFTYEVGGRRVPGIYDIDAADRLQRAFNNVDEAPALIVLCLGDGSGLRGGAAVFAAAEALSTLGRFYEARLGCGAGGGEIAVLYDNRALTLRSWAERHPRVAEDRRDVARFAVRGAATELLVVARQWDAKSGDLRYQQAKVVDGYGRHRLGVLLAGNLNATASGPHLPACDWARVGFPRRAHQARQLDDGRWVPDTRSVDHLVGRWAADIGSRIEGSGFHPLAELAYRTGTPLDLAFTATTQAGTEPAVGLLVDWLMVNDAIAASLEPGSYRVHVSGLTAIVDHPSDHRLLTATLRL